MADSHVDPASPQSSPIPRIVAIGASAGGLESLEKLFRALPSDPGLAFVVVQHLAPNSKSLMAELLARFTELRATIAVDHTKVVADQIYLLPAGKELEIENGHLRVFEREPRGGLWLPIDRFLSSLARDAGSRAIAIILSGSGTDGSRGVRRIREAGGLVLVEDPMDARFDGMPLAAIESGMADVVLPADALGQDLVERCHELDAAAKDPDRDLFNQISRHLREPLGIDFTLYKFPTVSRRIDRRMQLRGMEEVEAYLDLLQVDVDEVLALGHDLLIGVTQFFRDPPIWEFLEGSVIPRLIAEADPGKGIRAWVAGCATGEEAYSVAMALLDAVPDGMPVKVFATDVHRPALAEAERGLYDLDRLKNVSNERRVRYFVPGDNGRLSVSTTLRRAVVFASHNLLKDAPFTRLDLVTCRNVLIYFRSFAQRQALTLMQHGLRVGGALLLGPSESLGELASDYEVVSEANRIFTRIRKSPRGKMARARPVRRIQPPRPSDSGRLLLPMYDAVLDRVMPPAFLTDAERRLIDCFGGAEGYLRVKSRRSSSDIIELAPESVRVLLAGAMARVLRQQSSMRLDDVEWPTNGQTRRFDVIVDALSSRDRQRMCLIRLLGRASSARPVDVETLGLQDISIERVAALERDLAHSRETLQSTLEELETNSEQMQATNEELIASNEELQSTNEELHSVNAELHSVNAELQSKIQELTELNRDMRQLFESIDVALIFLDSQLRIRRYTPAAAELFGLLEHDVGRPLASFNHPLRRPQLIDDLQACLAQGSRLEYEVSDVHGRMHLVQIHADHDDDSVGAVLSVTDLTPLVAARRRVQTLSAVVDSTADAILALDLDRRITVWNQAAEDLYGYRGEEMRGKLIDEFVPEDLRGELAQAIAEIDAGAPLVSLETVRLHRDGTPLDISSTLSPILDIHDERVGYSKIDRDIGARRRREAELLERERRLDDAFNNSPDMLASIDLKTGLLVDFNQTMLEALGYTREELTQLHVSELYAPQSQLAAHEAVNRLRETGEIRDVELTMCRKDGTELEIAVSATTIRDADGQPLRSRSVLRDNSDRKRAEQALAEAMRMREHFLATVSHELRTPMHAIHSAVELVADSRSDPDERTRALGVLERQSAHMTRLLDDLLDVARITENKLEFVRQPLDLRDPVREACDAWSSSYSQRQVELVSTGLDVPMPVFGDAARLQQAVSNLLGNALRHSPTGGRVHVSLERTGERARLSVTDNGDGIDPQHLEAIFQLFAPAQSGLAHRGALGLGLSVARHIVTSHGGTIEARSEGLGRGAQFCIEVPLSSHAFPKPVEPQDSESVRLVLIEDQDDSREMLTLLLEKEGHRVFAADCGMEGVSLILRERPDLALVDIGLPDIDGYEVARRVRAEFGDLVPLIALTGYGQPEDISRSQAAGFQLHLTKPLRKQKLEAAIQGVLDQEPA